MERRSGPQPRHGHHGWRHKQMMAPRYKRLFVLMTVVGMAAAVAGMSFGPPVEATYLQAGALAFLGGLGILGFRAGFLRRPERRVRFPDDVRDELGLTLLGTVPHVPASVPQNGVGETAEVGEAFRVVRRNLMHVHGKTEPVVVAVTSPSAGEGKSHVSANLAHEFSGRDRRTLVVDTDVLGRNRHRASGGRGAPGLTDYLAGRATLEQVIRPATNGGPDRIDCGARSPRASSLFRSSAMANLLGELRSMYDVILIMTSPLDAGPEAEALGKLAGNLVIVLRAGATDRKLAMAQLEMLDRLPINVLGGVLNAVPQNGTRKPHRPEPENDAWDREQIRSWQHVQEAEAAAATNARDERPQLGKVYEPNGDSGDKDAEPAVAEDAAEDGTSVEPPPVVASVEPARPAEQVEPAPVQRSEPVVSQPEVEQDPPAPASDKDDIWYEPEWDLWYNPDWEVRADTLVTESPATLAPNGGNGAAAAPQPEEQPKQPQDDLPFSLDTPTLEPEKPGGNGGNGGNGEAELARERPRVVDRRREQQRLTEWLKSEKVRRNGDRHQNGDEKGNGRQEELLDAYAAAQLEKFREHQRRHHQRHWK